MNSATRKTRRHKLPRIKKRLREIVSFPYLGTFSLGQGNSQLLWNTFHVRYEFRNSKYENIYKLSCAKIEPSRNRVLLSLTLFPLGQWNPQVLQGNSTVRFKLSDSRYVKTLSFYLILRRSKLLSQILIFLRFHAFPPRLGENLEVIKKKKLFLF